MGKDKSGEDGGDNDEHDSSAVAVDSNKTVVFLDCFMDAGEVDCCCSGDLNFMAGRKDANWSVENDRQRFGTIVATTSTSVLFRGCALLSTTSKDTKLARAQSNAELTLATNETHAK